MKIETIRDFYQNHQPAPIGRYRYLSVLVPFVRRDDGELCVLFEMRALDMEVDPGEICFPGGHMEGDETPLACALRETAEEIGIPPEKVKIFGPGDMILGFANYTLYTTVGEIAYEDYLNAVVQRSEVDHVFLIPLRFFMENEPFHYETRVNSDVSDFPNERVGIGKDYNWRRGRWSIPIYDEYEGYVVWGLTARIVEHVAQQLKEAANE